MNSIDYTYLFRKKYTSGGYTTISYKLPPWITVRITTTSEDKYLEVLSEIHITKKEQVGPSYSLDFQNQTLLRDLSEEIIKRYID